MERNAGLKEGVTDGSLQALAAAGCGKNLMSLHLDSECLFLLLCLVCYLCPCVSSVLRLAPPLLGVASSLSPSLARALSSSCFSLLSLSADKGMERNAALKSGVTDGSLQALAAAGCGKNLTSLHLQCVCLFLLLCLAFFLFFFCSMLGSLSA